MIFFDFPLDINDSKIQVRDGDKLLHEWNPGSRDEYYYDFEAPSSVFLIDQQSQGVRIQRNLFTTLSAPSEWNNELPCDLHTMHSDLLPIHWWELTGPLFLLTTAADIESFDQECLDRIFDAVRLGQNFVIRIPREREVVDLQQLLPANLDLALEHIQSVNTWKQQRYRIGQLNGPELNADRNVLLYRSMIVPYGLGRIVLVRYEENYGETVAVEDDIFVKNKNQLRFITDHQWLHRDPLRREEFYPGIGFPVFFGMVIFPGICLVLFLRKSIRWIIIAIPVAASILAIAQWSWAVYRGHYSDSNLRCSFTWLDCASQKAASFSFEDFWLDPGQSEQLQYDRETLPVLIEPKYNRFSKSEHELDSIIFPTNTPIRHRKANMILAQARSGHSNASIEVQTTSKQQIESITNRLGVRATFLAVSNDGQTWSLVRDVADHQTSKQIEKLDQFDLIAAWENELENSTGFRSQGYGFGVKGAFRDFHRQTKAKIRTGKLAERIFIAIASEPVAVQGIYSQNDYQVTIELIIGKW